MNTNSNNAEHHDEHIELASPLDPVQVERISAVHRGFLYQHLYGVACLLTVARIDATIVIVERDEDIEVAMPSSHFYVQVKTRNRPLQPADIAGAMERFDSLRKEHIEHRRAGNPSFLIVSNVELGPTLKTAFAAHDWPDDVALKFPGSSSQSQLPPAWPTVDDAFRWCAG